MRSVQSSWVSLNNCQSCFNLKHLSSCKVLFFAVIPMSLLATTLYLLYKYGEGTNTRNVVVRNDLPLAKLLLVPKLQRRLLLLILVPSAPTNFEQRNAIRKTWGDATVNNIKSLGKSLWKVVFVIGRNNYIDTEVTAEAEKNADILICELRDSYENLVLKTLTAFLWASTVNCTFVLKADDDVYVHVPRLIQWLLDPQLPLRLYAGQVHSTASPVRRTNSKYFVSEETYSRRHYPPYCGGPFYILSSDILGDMLHAAKYFKLLTIEDAYMGILAASLGVTPVHIREFKLYFPFTEKDIDEFSVCDFTTFLAVGHQMSATLIQNVHINLKAVESLGIDAGCFWKKFYLPFILCAVFYTLFVAARVIYRHFQLIRPCT